MSVVSQVQIPEAKPAFELIDERLVQKVSPRYRHAKLQLTLGRLLTDWAGDRGRVGSEWRFHLNLPGSENSVVPDVAYLSYDRLPAEAEDEAEEPRVAPDIAVEILSPSDWRGHVDRKTELYLAAGTSVVMEVDPRARTVTLYDRDGRQIYRDGDTAAHPSFPGLQVDVTALFATLRP